MTELGQDELNSFEEEMKMGVIDAGVNECRNLLGKQKTIEDYFFYEGSIDGFEECKSFRKMADFEKRI